MVPLKKKKSDSQDPFCLSRQTMPELFSHNRSDRDLSLLGGLIITLIYSAWSRKKRINQTLCHCFLKVKTFDCSQRQRKWYISVIPPKTTNTSTQKTEQAAYYYRPPPKNTKQTPKHNINHLFHLICLLLVRDKLQYLL